MVAPIRESRIARDFVSEGYGVESKAISLLPNNKIAPEDE
jgi:hypothetical protein